MSWASLAGRDVSHEVSTAESTRFGLLLDRVTVGARADPSTRASALTRAVERTDADVVVVRYPADAGDCAAAVAATPGRDVLPAGALVYWALTPGTRRAPTAHADLHVVDAAEVGDPATLTEAVVRVVKAAFEGYTNHYSFNPLLDDAAARAGYLEWATTTTRTAPSAANRTHIGTVVLLHGREAVGVATTSIGFEHNGTHHVEVLLAGLARPWQGRGWYATLLGGVAERAFATGAERLVISTQVHNTRVQRAWARAGLEPFTAVETVHLVRSGLLALPG